MQWLAQPPAVQMKVAKESPTELVLEGPHVNARIGPGITATMGASVTIAALRMFRGLPGPLRIIPVAAAVLGAGLTALGVSGVFARCSVRVSRRGIEWRWRYGPLPERTAWLDAKDVRAVEVRTVEHHGSDDGWPVDWTTSVVQVVTGTGAVMGLAEEGEAKRAQARRDQVDAILHGRPGASRPKPGARRRRPAKRRPATHEG